MDDPRDLPLVERAVERSAIGDVAGHPIDARRVGAEDELQPVQLLSEVVADDLVAVVEQRPCRPGTEAAEHARDENALSHRPVGRPGTP